MPCPTRDLPLPAKLRKRVGCALVFIALAPAPIASQAAKLPATATSGPACPAWDLATAQRDPSPAELRCRYGMYGPGRFGLSSYLDVPVYQPRTPMPGTHVVAVPGMPRPAPGESYEAWEWRTLRARFGSHVQRVENRLEVLDPRFAARLLRLERRLNEERIPFRRRETWRSPERQAFLFQQGRSRPGRLATATLTSWHCMVDGEGKPAGRAADYNVPWRHLPRFHELAREIGLHSFGADSNDPGHVFLPPSPALDSREIVLLRLLPRVPLVTLATGRPMDERVDAKRMAEYRAAARRFSQQEVGPDFEPELAPTTGVKARTHLEKIEPTAAPEPPRL